MAIVRFYDASKNPSGGAFSGVPLGDIDDVTWAELPEHLQVSVDASGMYRKTSLPKDAPKPKPKPKEKEKKPVPKNAQAPKAKAKANKPAVVKPPVVVVATPAVDESAGTLALEEAQVG